MATKQRILMADITPEGVDGALVLIYSKPAMAGELSEQEVIEFLENFKLGKGQ